MDTSESPSSQPHRPPSSPQETNHWNGWRPHDFRRIFVTDAIRSGLPPHIAAKVCGHSTVDTTMGYAAIYPEDVISHHRAFIARRRAERPSEEYRDITTQKAESRPRDLRP